MGFISELIGIPLGWLMKLIYMIVSNYGISIAIFTLIVRVILFPLSVKQQKSTAAMAAMQPKLDKLKKQYAKNPEKLQEEQMKLYSEEDINPMASCTPMIFQLLFLYGVFDVIYRPLTHIVGISKEAIASLKLVAASLYENNQYFNSRPEIYILQAVQNESNRDMFLSAEGVTPEMIESISQFSNKLFGVIDLGAIPKSVFGESFAATPENIGLILIPVISGVIQLIMTFYSTAKQRKLNPEVAAQMGGMNAMLYMMPILSVWMAFSFPAGIGFYWICSSLVGLLQSVILNKVYTPEYVQKLIEKDKQKKKNSKRKGFMQKYNEMLQEQMKQQGYSTGNRNITAASVSKDDNGEDIKLSKSQMKEYERKIIAEARRRQAEKYGDEYIEDDND